MRTESGRVGLASVVVLCLGVVLLTPRPLDAHCDTLDGPVVTDARAALEMGDVSSVLKWVKAEHEETIRSAFKDTLTVRKKGPEAKALADKFFFETLVRLHRAGEGAPYTGLKPAGTDPVLAVRKADEALEVGTVDKLVKLVTDDVAAGIRERFNRTLQRKHHAAESVDAGREFVKSYVELVHYVERIHHHATTKTPHHADSNGGKAEGL